MGSIGQEERHISFEFNLDKFVNAVTYFAEKVEGADKLKIVKLLYFADKYHLVSNGMPIIGDWYAKLPLGPIPSNALNILGEAEASFPHDEFQKEVNKLKEYIEIDKQPKYPIFKPKKSFSKDIFSETELEAMEETLKRYGKYDGARLSNITHSHPAYCETLTHDIDYRLFFKDDKDADPSMLELMELEQEDRDFTAALQKDLKDD